LAGGCGGVCKHRAGARPDYFFFYDNATKQTNKGHHLYGPARYAPLRTAFSAEMELDDAVISGAFKDSHRPGQATSQNLDRGGGGAWHAAHVGTWPMCVCLQGGAVARTKEAKQPLQTSDKSHTIRGRLLNLTSHFTHTH
jgi:hypothetical protein